MEEIEISGLDSLGCATCPKNCCKAWRTKEKDITVFRGEIDTDPEGPFIQTMTVDKDGCKFLVNGNMCGVFNDPKRYVTCSSYPFTIGIGDSLYVSSTCESLQKLLYGISMKDPEIIAYVRRSWDYLKQHKVAQDLAVKTFWENQHRSRAVMIEINKEAIYG